MNIVIQEAYMGKVVCIMLAGGKGKRMGTKVSKQYLLLDEKPVLFYSLKAFEEYVDEIVVVAAKGEEKYCRENIIDKYNIKKVSNIVTGGAERYLSVYEGLKEVKEMDEDTYVLIHDGARPFISGRTIEATIEKVKATGACIVAVPSKDTVKIGSAYNTVESTPNRSNVWLVQTPQAFRYENIFKAYKQAIASGRKDITDDSMVMESFGDKEIYFVEGDYDNIKLTTPEDLVHGMAILRAKMDFEKNI